MTSPSTETGLTPLDLLACQQEAIDNLATSIELLQRQMTTLRRRLQALEGVPVPEHEPPD